MIIEAKNKEHRARYCIYVDGTDVSAAVLRADDVAHEVTVCVRDDLGQQLRREDGTLLTATLRGRVMLVPRVLATQMPAVRM